MGGEKCMSSVRVTDIPWPQVERRLDSGAVALLPVGAAAKAHGPHLPMGTDCQQAERLAGELAARTPALIWPTLSYGHYPAFLDYPGSCSLSRKTFVALAGEVIEDILRAGAQRVLVLNTGLSTIRPLQEAARHVSRPEAVRLTHVYRGRHYLETAARLERQRHGSHADEVETSLMLAIAPRLVDMVKARSWDERAFEPGPFSRRDPNSPNYSPSGIYGDPTLANREKGERILESMLDDLLADLADWE